MPGTPALGDEGAANHTRLCASHGDAGVEIFTFGRGGFDRSEQGPKRFPARQTREASEEKNEEEDESDEELEGSLSETKAEAPRPKHRKGERPAPEEAEDKSEGDPGAKQTPAPEG